MTSNESDPRPKARLTIKTSSTISPPKARKADDPLPTLAERNAQELAQLSRETQPRPKRTSETRARQTQGSKPPPRFVHRDGHVLEPVGYLGKLSPVTQAQDPTEKILKDNMKEGLKKLLQAPTLADRVREVGVAQAMGLDKCKPASPKDR